MTRATVALLNWNGGPFVESCVSSVLAQSEPSLEVILVDNGSTDGSDTAIIDLLRRSTVPHEAIVLTRNIGICGGLQQALDRARGRYFFPFASDDVMLPHRLKIQCEQLDAAPPDTNVAAGAVALIDAGGEPIRGRWLRRSVLKPARYGDQRRTRELACRPVVPPAPGMAFRTSALRNVGGYDPGAPIEDVDLFMRLVLVGESAVVTTKRVVSLYRRHTNNISSNSTVMGDGLEYTVGRLVAQGVDLGPHQARWDDYLAARSQGYRSPWPVLLQSMRERPLDHDAVRADAAAVLCSKRMSRHRKTRAAIAYVSPRIASRLLTGRTK